MISSQQFLNNNKNCPKCTNCGSKMTFWLKLFNFDLLIYKCWDCKSQFYGKQT